MFKYKIRFVTKKGAKQEVRQFHHLDEIVPFYKTYTKGKVTYIQAREVNIHHEFVYEWRKKNLLLRIINSILDIPDRLNYSHYEIGNK